MPLVPTDEDPFASDAPAPQSGLKAVDFDPFAAPAADAPATAEPSFLDRMNSYVKNYAESTSDPVKQQLISGQINPVSYAIQKTGQAGEDIGNGVYNAMTAVPKMAWNMATLGDKTTNADIPQPIKDVGNYASGAIQNGVNYLKNTGIGQGISSIAAAHPEATEDAKSLIKATGVLSPAVGLASAIKEAAPSVAEVAAARGATGAETKDASSEIYKNLPNLPFSQAQHDNLISDLDALTPESSGVKSVWKRSGAPREIRAIKDAISEGPLDMQGAVALRSKLNGVINKAYIGGATDTDVSHLLNVKNALTDTIKDNDGTGEWAQANHEFAKGSTLETLENFAAKSATKAQPTTAIDTAINNFINSKKSAGLPASERSALKDVTNNSKFDKLKQAAGSGLFKYAATSAGSALGPVGAGAGYLLGTYGSLAAKDAAYAAKLSKLDKAMDVIRNRPMAETAPPIPRAPKPKPPLDFHNPIPAGAELPSHAGYAASPATEFYTGRDVGTPSYYPPTMAAPSEDPFAPSPSEPEPTDIMRAFFKNKASGGRIGFKLKPKGKK
jgi:hypothetical protein